LKENSCARSIVFAAKKLVNCLPKALRQAGFITAKTTAWFVQTLSEIDKEEFL